MADALAIPLGVRMVIDTMNRRAETLPSQWDDRTVATADCDANTG
jgi:hypothetical protein